MLRADADADALPDVGLNHGRITQARKFARPRARLIGGLPIFVGMMLVANIYELRLFGELIPVVLAAFVLVFHELLQGPEGGADAPAEVEER